VRLKLGVRLVPKNAQNVAHTEDLRNFRRTLKRIAHESNAEILFADQVKAELETTEVDVIVIRFTTSLFDVTKERANNINPIHGESLLLWLAHKLKGEVEAPEPQTEDWGWYVDIEWKGRSYMLGASASDEEKGQREWVLQIVKHRTLKERVLGREKMTAQDECATHLRRLIENEKAFSAICVD
jgi:hypothetical protein